MKNIYTFLVCLIASAFFSFSPSSSDFQGKLIYDISIDAANMPEPVKAMFSGSTFTIYIKENKARVEMEMAMQNTISISDRKTNTTVTLMDVMGNKFMIKSDNKKSEEKTPEVTVKELSETKTIAGYLCKKAEVVFKDQSGKEHSTFIFYTEDISNQLQYDHKNNYLKGIKGMPLEYEVIAENGMTMKMVAKSVSKEEVADSKFEIPAGYKETTAEELQKEMMKMMKGQ